MSMKREYEQKLHVKLEECLLKIDKLKWKTNERRLVQ
jgi:hypothetical protein